MIKQVLSLTDMSAFSVSSLLLFFFVFIIMTLWTLRKESKSKYDYIDKLPLDSSEKVTKLVSPN